MLYSQVSYIETNFMNYFYVCVLLLKVDNPYMPLTGHTRVHPEPVAGHQKLMLACLWNPF